MEIHSPDINCVLTYTEWTFISHLQRVIASPMQFKNYNSSIENGMLFVKRNVIDNWLHCILEERLNGSS